MARLSFRAGCFAAALIAFLTAHFAVSNAAPAPAMEVIEAGASQNHFYIEPSYDGSSIALFGAIDRTKLNAGPFDIAVTLRGPTTAVTVWKKALRAGFLWVNSESVAFDNVPNYYAVLSTKPLAAIASQSELQEREIGIGALDLQFEADPGPDIAPPRPRAEFRDALIELKRAAKLFVEDGGGVEFLGASLFRARVFLPPAAGPGLYRANFFVLQGGVVIGEARAHIRLNKVGIEASLSSAAINHPWLYGVLSVALAAAVGGVASLVFRRV